MDERLCAIIKVRDLSGNWYTNAMVASDYDALRICKFYREQLGYHVQLWIGGQDMTSMIDAAKVVKVPRGVL